MISSWTNSRLFLHFSPEFRRTVYRFNVEILREKGAKSKSMYHITYWLDGMINEPKLKLGRMDPGRMYFPDTLTFDSSIEIV